MVISTNSTPHSAACSTEIKHNDSSHPVIDANISLNNNITPILPTELTILLSETIEYDLSDNNQNDALQNKQKAYLFATQSALNDIKNGNKETEKGTQNIIYGRITKDQALIKQGEALVEQGKALTDRNLSVGD